MSEAGDFIDSALRYESSTERAESDRERIGAGLTFYGSSVGAVRGTVRDALRRNGLDEHDAVLSLASELWADAVYERRLAAVVLLQSRVTLVRNSDLTRIEGFLRDGRAAEIVDPLVRDVVVPAITAWEGRPRLQADAVARRWAADLDPWLRHAAAAIAAGTDVP